MIILEGLVVWMVVLQVLERHEALTAIIAHVVEIASRVGCRTLSIDNVLD